MGGFLLARVPSFRVRAHAYEFKFKFEIVWGGLGRTPLVRFQIQI